MAAAGPKPALSSHHVEGTDCVKEAPLTTLRGHPAAVPQSFWQRPDCEPSEDPLCWTTTLRLK